MNYGVIGTGYFGAELARYTDEIEGAKVVSVYDPDNAKPIAEELNCDVSNSIDEIVSREDIDCIIVASPNNVHKEPVVKAAQNGKHVFCEKPIALSYEDCVEMVEACEENGVIFMAGHIMNFYNGVQHAKKLINDGVIGKVLYCHSARNGWEEHQPQVSWKKMRDQSGGHLYHHIHELDFVQFIMGGLPHTATMVGGNVAHKGENFGDEDDLIVASLEFDDDRYAVLEWGSSFRWGEHYVLIEGTKGAIKLDLFDVKGTLKVDGEVHHFLIHESEEEDKDRTRIYNSASKMDGPVQYGGPGTRTPLWLTSLIKREMKYFDDVVNGKPVSKEFEKLLNGKAALEAIATADACTLSREEDRKVKLSEITSQ